MPSHQTHPAAPTYAGVLIDYSGPVLSSLLGPDGDFVSVQAFADATYLAQELTVPEMTVVTTAAGSPWNALEQSAKYVGTYGMPWCNNGTPGAPPLIAPSADAHAAVVAAKAYSAAVKAAKHPS